MNTRTKALKPEPFTEMNNTNKNPSSCENEFSFGTFELNDMNEMCLKTVIFNYWNQLNDESFSRALQ